MKEKLQLLNVEFVKKPGVDMILLLVDCIVNAGITDLSSELESGDMDTLAEAAGNVIV